MRVSAGSQHSAFNLSRHLLPTLLLPMCGVQVADYMCRTYLPICWCPIIHKLTTKSRHHRPLPLSALLAVSRSRSNLGVWDPSHAALHNALHVGRQPLSD